MENTTKYYGVLLPSKTNPIQEAQDVLAEHYDISLHTDSFHFSTDDGAEYKWSFLPIEAMPVSADIRIVEVKKLYEYEYYIQRQGFEKVHGPYTQPQLRVELFRTKHMPGYRDPMWKVNSILKRKITA